MRSTLLIVLVLQAGAAFAGERSFTPSTKAAPAGTYYPYTVTKIKLRPGEKTIKLISPINLHNMQGDSSSALHQLTREEGATTTEEPVFGKVKIVAKDGRLRSSENLVETSVGPGTYTNHQWHRVVVEGAEADKGSKLRNLKDRVVYHGTNAATVAGTVLLGSSAGTAVAAPVAEALGHDKAAMTLGWASVAQFAGAVALVDVARRLVKTPAFERGRQLVTEAEEAKEAAAARKFDEKMNPLGVASRRTDR
jgi:hypothetical protein